MSGSGFLSEYQKHANKISGATELNEFLSYFTLGSAFADRVYHLFRGRPLMPNLFGLLVADSGVGKSMSLTTSHDVLNHFRAELQCPELTTAEMCVRRFGRTTDSDGNDVEPKQTTGYMMYDEAEVFARMTGEKSYAANLREFIKQTYDSNKSILLCFAKDQQFGKANPTIREYRVDKNVRVSFVAATVRKALSRVVSAMGHSGLAERFFFILFAGQTRVEDSEELRTDESEIAGLASILGIINDWRNQMGQGGVFHLPADNDVRKYFQSLHFKAVEEMGKHESAEPEAFVWGRYATKVRKLATIIALDEMSPHITDEIAQRAAAIVENWRLQGLRLFAEPVIDKTGLARTADTIMKIVMAKGGAEFRNPIYGNLGRYRQAFSEALNLLISSDRIRVVHVRRPGVGGPTAELLVAVDPATLSPVGRIPDGYVTRNGQK